MARFKTGWFPSTKVWFLGTVILAHLLFLVSCARSPLKDQKFVFKPSDCIENLTDTLPLDSLQKSLELTIERLQKIPPSVRSYSAVTFDSQKNLAAYQRILEALPSVKGQTDLRTLFKNNFNCYSVYGSSNWSEVFVTGYYQPVIEARNRVQGRFTQALFGDPPDMIDIDWKAFAKVFGIDEVKVLRSRLKGRMVTSDARKSIIEPFPDRKEIEDKKISAKAIAYLDPIDAFFLQIQGSGALIFPDKKRVRVGYANQNGHPYIAVGKFVLSIPKAQLNGVTLESYMRSLNAMELQDFLNKNPSYVFFKVMEGEPQTTFQVPPVAERTIAIDPEFFPLGSLAYLDISTPEFQPQKPSSEDSSVFELKEWVKRPRLVLAQDTGGAIRGPARVDLFFGEGSLAKAKASLMKEKAQLYFLFAR